MSEATVVTSENFAEFAAKRMGLTNPETPPEAPKVAPEAPKADPAPDAPTETPEAKEPPQEPPKPEESEEDKRKRKASERFQELANDNRTLRERTMAMEQEMDALKAKLTPPEAPITEKPDPTKYQDIEAYTSDVAKWARQEAERESAKAREQQEATQRQQTWAERVVSSRKEIPDFDDVVGNSSVGVNDGIRDALLRSPVGPKLLYELAKDPGVADKLNKMSPYEALMELGAMSARITMPKAAEPKQTPIASMSSAPPPITPIRGGGSNAVPVEDGKFTGTYAQYKEARSKGLIK